MINRRDLISGSLVSLGIVGCSSSSLALKSTPSLSSQYPGLIFGKGPTGRCDDKKVGVAVPRWDPEKKRFLLWYSCRDQEFDSDAPAGMGTGRVGFATSKDGIAWERVDGAQAKGSVIDVSPDENNFDSLHIAVTDVMSHQGNWWMSVLGGHRDGMELDGKVYHGFKMLSGLASSPDGLRWQRHAGPEFGGSLVGIPEGELFATWPNCLADDQGDFFLYTTSTISGVGPFKTWIAVSEDQGATWISKGRLKWLDEEYSWEEAGIMTRHIQRNPFPGPRWLMIYSALGPPPTAERSIAAAVSDDLIHWRHLYDKPIFTKSEDDESWDGVGVSAPQLLVVDGKVMLYYFGMKKKELAEVPNGGLGLAISETGDLQNFKRYI